MVFKLALGMLGLFLTIAWFGFTGPYLVSARNNDLVLLGIAGTALYFPILYVIVTKIMENKES